MTEGAQVSIHNCRLLQAQGRLQTNGLNAGEDQEQDGEPQGHCAENTVKDIQTLIEVLQMRIIDVNFLGSGRSFKSEFSL